MVIIQETWSKTNVRLKTLIERDYMKIFIKIINILKYLFKRVLRPGSDLNPTVKEI